MTGFIQEQTHWEISQTSPAKEDGEAAAGATGSSSG